MNYAILRGFDNSDLGSFFQVFCTFSGNLSLFIETDGLFEKKQRVVFLENNTLFVLFQGTFFKLSPTKFLFPRKKFLFRPRK